MDKAAVSGAGRTSARLGRSYSAGQTSIGMLAYAFKGIGKFAVEMLPHSWQLTTATSGYFTDVPGIEQAGDERTAHFLG